jgi:hypothetical protein
MHKRWAKLAKATEADIRVAHKGGSILIYVRLARGYNREAIIGRCHARRLDLPLENIIDET